MRSTHALHPDSRRAPTTTPCVTIRRFGQRIEFSPEVPELTEAFYTARQTAVVEPAGRVTIESHRVPLIHPGGGGDDQWGFAGLEKLAAEFLAGQGHRVRRLQPASLPAPVNSGTFDPQLLEFVRREPRGIIEFEPQEVKVAGLIADIVRAWPQLKILVLAATIDEARNVVCELRRLVAGLEPLLLTGGTTHVPDPLHHRVAVTTLGYCGDGAVELERRDIAFLLHAEHVVHANAEPLLERTDFTARFYGVVAAGRPFSPAESDQLLAVFGLDRHRVSDQREATELLLPVPLAYRAPVRVVAGESQLKLKQRTLWGNRRRNTFVANLARLARSGSVRRLRRAGADVPRFLAGQEERRVVVLVESIEHGWALSRELAGWPVVVHRRGRLQGLPGYRASRPGEGAGEIEIVDLEATDRTMVTDEQCDSLGTICTFAGLVHLSRPDIIIRADGSCGHPAWPQKILNASSESFPVIIDIQDLKHPVLRRWSRARWATYGDPTDGVEVVAGPTPLERFLEARPEVMCVLD